MSGICGLIRLDGGPASKEQLEPSWSALARRAPDGGAVWAEGEVALGFRLLATTREAAVERQPLSHEDSGCVIVADARLDNRDELAAALDLDPRGRGDGELILQAYLRWGEEAPLHLLGDFAFAIWDDRRHRLFAARDPAGMRQLHYAYLPGRVFLFATDEVAVAANPGVPARIDLLRIAEFLIDLEGADLASTFRCDIKRLPPAHLLMLENGRMALRRYWRIEPKEPLLLASDGEYAEGLLDVFGKATKARLRGGQVGAMLSGGLDSSSIVAVARSHRDGLALPVFSAVDGFGEPDEETRMIRRVQALPGLAPHEVTPSEARVGPAMLASVNPFDGGMSLIANVYAEASAGGCKVVLDGAAGDVLLDHRNWGARLVRQGRLREAWNYARDERTFYRETSPAAALFLANLRAALLPDPARLLRRAATLVLRRHFPAAGVIAPGFARQVGLAESQDRFAGMAPSPRLPFSEDRAAVLLHPNQTVGRERYDRVASAFAIEPRDPYNDRRLLEFALRLPASQLVRSGWTKHIMRVAMGDLLPDDVRWRRGKSHLGPQFTAARLAEEKEVWRDALERNRTRLLHFVTKTALQQAADLGTLLNRQDLQRIVHLALWLDGQADLT